MKLYFIRHGESEANVGRVFSNHGIRHPLTPLGMEQASRAADELKSVRFDRVYTSPVLRAIQTTQILVEHWGIRRYTVHEDLREFDVGVFEGRSDDASWNQYFALEERWKDPGHRDERLEGGESFHDVQTRLARFVGEVLAQADADENVLAVGHAGLFKVGLPAVFDNVDFGFAHAHMILNCQVIVGVTASGGLRCERWGTQTGTALGPRF
jgi:probable phosphoglycerate mutase